MDHNPKWVDSVRILLRFTRLLLQTCFFSLMTRFLTIYWVYKVGIMLVTETAFEAHDINPHFCWVLWCARLMSFMLELKKRLIGMLYHDISSVLIGPFLMYEYSARGHKTTEYEIQTLVLQIVQSEQSEHWIYYTRVLIILSSMSTISNVCRKSYINVK